MAKEIRNVGASVRARLLQLAKASGQSFDLVLTRSAREPLLFRLSRSLHARGVSDSTAIIGTGDDGDAWREHHFQHISEDTLVLFTMKILHPPHRQ